MHIQNVVLGENGTSIAEECNVNSSNISNEYSLKDLLNEAYELEKKCWKLKKSIDLVPLYQRLSNRINGLQNGGDERVVTMFKNLLKFKMSDLEIEHNLIVDIESFIDLTVTAIERRNNIFSNHSTINDAELSNSFDQLKIGINGNFFIEKYHQIIDAFQLTYFPFAADYLEKYRLPVSFTDYNDVNAIHSATTANLNELKVDIGTINSESARISGIQNSDITDPDSAFFTWKNSDVREKIRKLFSGEKIELLADVKQASTQFNALRFNTIDLAFRSSNQSITDELMNFLGYFDVTANHTGQSAIRCNNDYYNMTTPDNFIFFTFEKYNSNPTHRNVVYDKLRDNKALLSPYAMYEFQLASVRGKNKFQKLQPFIELVDIELHGTGTFLEEDAPICENKKLPNFYSKI